jgi:hypothetical protein
MADALAAAVERLRARAETAPAEPGPALAEPTAREPHRQSMSALARWGKRRKQRKEARAARRGAS